MDVRAENRERWNRQVAAGNPWTRPVSPAVVAAARRGEWSVVLTEQRPVPAAWWPPVADRDVLCLASGGGQQGPVLAAAGARVTVFDNSPAQLDQDRLVAAREGLALRTVEGDMRDLSAFADASFDLICHPVSNVFCPEIRPVWREAYRVLRAGGVLLAGFMNPAVYLFDSEPDADGQFRVKYPLPFDSRVLTAAERDRIFGPDGPWEFSHSLEDQLGGQLDAGFVLTAMYEDRTRDPIGAYAPSYLATRAVKL